MNLEVLTYNQPENSKILQNRIIPLFNTVLNSENFFYSVLSISKSKHYDLYHLDLYDKITKTDNYSEVINKETVRLVGGITNNFTTRSVISIYDCRTIIFDKKNFENNCETVEGISYISSEILFNHCLIAGLDKSLSIRDHKEQFLEYILKERFKEAALDYAPIFNRL